MAIDLHVHTSLSDSDLSPERTAALARELGVQILALTDHDTLTSVRRARELDGVEGIRVLGGVEISAWDPVYMRKVHILGYGVDPDHAALHKLCDETTRARRRSIDESLDRLMMRYPIDVEALYRYAGQGGLYKQHIMHYLLARGFAAALFGQEYRKLFGRDGAAYAPMSYPDCRLAIEAVVGAGGIACVAHMLLYGNDVFLPEMMEAGLSAVEVRHPGHDKKGELRLTELCRKNDLLVTCGSDWHGYYGDHPWGIGSKSLEASMVRPFLERLDIAAPGGECHDIPAGHRWERGLSAAGEIRRTAQG